MKVVFAIGTVQAKVLHAIADDPHISAPDLCDATGVWRSSGYRALAHMEQLGLVAMEPMSVGRYLGAGSRTGRFVRTYTLTTAGYVMLDVIAKNGRNGHE